MEALSTREVVAVGHTDFAKKFIKAEVLNISKLLDIGGWREYKQKGMLKIEEKDYEFKDKDVIEFKVGSG